MRSHFSEKKNSGTNRDSRRKGIVEKKRGNRDKVRKSKRERRGRWTKRALDVREQT